MADHLKPTDDFDGPAAYVLRVAGILNPRAAEWFDGLVLSIEPEPEMRTTLLHCVVRDQAALRGLLTRIWNLNLKLLSAAWVTAEMGPNLSEEIQEKEVS